MKTSKIIILFTAFSFLLGIISFYSIAISHEVYYIILPFLADPIVHFLSYIGYFADCPIHFLFLELILFFPIFWPVVVFLLIKMKYKLAPYVILISIYAFILIVSSYRLINEPDMLGKTIGSVAVFVEPLGIMLFILGQVGIFYVLRLKKEGRLH